MVVLQIADAAKRVEHALLPLAGILFVWGFVTLSLYASILRALRTRHPDVWKGLGSPTLITNNSLKNTLATRRFLRHREYAKLGDEQLDQTIRWHRLLERAYLVYFAFCVALVIATWTID